MSLKFAIIYEATDDFEVAITLADRVICEPPDGFDPDWLEHSREWIGEHKLQRWTWRNIPNLAHAEKVRAHGHFDGKPGAPDAAAARLAIKYVLKVHPDVSAIVLMRDQDNQPERAVGLEQARVPAEQYPVPIAVGVAICKLEAWIIAGFVGSSEVEEAVLAQLRQFLGFHPHLESHKLTANDRDQDAKKRPKDVREKLTGGIVDRERKCWTHTPLSILRERGSDNGLSDYFDEVRMRLVPLFGHTKP
jgi:hypothetical protein